MRVDTWVMPSHTQAAGSPTAVWTWRSAGSRPSDLRITRPGRRGWSASTGSTRSSVGTDTSPVEARTRWCSSIADDSDAGRPGTATREQFAADDRCARSMRDRRRRHHRPGRSSSTCARLRRPVLNNPKGQETSSAEGLGPARPLSRPHRCGRGRWCGAGVSRIRRCAR